MISLRPSEVDRFALLPELQHHLLAFAATARWAVRFHQNYLADIALLEYKALSQKLSQGRSTDVLGISEDIAPKVWQHLTPEIRKLEEEAPPSVPSAPSNSPSDKAPWLRKRTPAVPRRPTLVVL